MRNERGDIETFNSHNYDKLEQQRRKWLPKGFFFIFVNLASLNALITTAKWVTTPNYIPDLNASFYFSAACFVTSIATAKWVFSSKHLPLDEDILRIKRWATAAKEEGYNFPISETADDIIYCGYLDSRDRVGEGLHKLLNDLNTGESEDVTPSL